jgi:hypothetical protein
MTSSASAERLFAEYTGMFQDNQQRILEDRREGSVMLRYNTRNRAKPQ